MKISTLLVAQISLTIAGSALFTTHLASAEIGVSLGEIVIGESTNETGMAPERSSSIMRGAGIVIKKFNAQGGAFGRKLRVVNYDDAYDAQKTVENIRKLISTDQVFALFQIFGTTNVSAILPIIEKARITLLAPATGSETLRNPVLPEVFNVRAGYDLESAEMVRFLSKEKGIQEVAIFYQEDAYGQNGMMSTQRKLDELHLKRIAKGGYDRKTNDITAALKEIKAANPKAVILWGTPKQSGTFVREAYKVGFKPIFVAASPALSTEFVTALEGTPAEVYFTDCIPFYSSKSLPVFQDYLKETKAAGIKENGPGFEGYMNGLVLVEAVKRSGADITREKFRAALETLKTFDVGGVEISFSATDHQGLDAATLVRLKDGVFQAAK